MSLEGLAGVEIGGKVIKSIHAHGEGRRRRTVKYTDGTQEDIDIDVLVDALVNSKSGGGPEVIVEVLEEKE